MGLKERITFAHASPFPYRYLQTGGWGKTPHQFANSLLKSQLYKQSPPARAKETLIPSHNPESKRWITSPAATLCAGTAGRSRMLLCAFSPYFTTISRCCQLLLCRIAAAHLRGNRTWRNWLSLRQTAHLPAHIRGRNLSCPDSPVWGGVGDCPNL